MWALSLAVNIAAVSALVPRQLAGPSTASAAVTQPTSLAVSNVSADSVAYSGDVETYYLGYREDDFKKPYAKYWNPVVSPLNREFANGLAASPWANALTYTAHEAHDYFTRPGYNDMDNGWSVDENGTVVIAVRSEIPQVTGEAYDWWFGWHSIETARYKLWNPVAHTYSWRTPSSSDWTGLTYPERYINTTSYIDEYVGQDSAKLSIGFVEPASLGFNVSQWPELGIETIVIGRVLIGKHSTTDWDEESYLMHQVRRMPNGYRELRSRFWIVENNHGSAQLGHDLAVHCNIEMTHLGSFLPAIFEEFKNEL